MSISFISLFHNFHLSLPYRLFRTQLDKVTTVALKITWALGEVLTSTTSRFSFSGYFSHHVVEVRETTSSHSDSTLDSQPAIIERVEDQNNLSNTHQSPPNNNQPFDYLPIDVTSIVLSYLSPKDLLSISCTCHRLNNLSIELIETEAKKRLGVEVAEIFRENTTSWNKVMSILISEFTPESDALAKGSTVIKYSSIEDQKIKDKLCALMNCVQKYDKNILKDIFEDLKQNDQLKYLYSLGNPLVKAIVNGQGQHAPLLIEYGVKDYTYSNTEGSPNSTSDPYLELDCVEGRSALFYAVLYGNIGLVEFLLKKGARSDLNFLNGKKKQSLIAVLVDSVPQKIEQRRKFILCLFLLLKGLKNSEKSEMIKNASLKIAILKEHIDIANLLYAMGARITSREQLDLKSIVINSFKKNNIKLIEFLHQRSIVDLKTLRVGSGATLLHEALSYGAEEILDYLIKIGVPKDIKNEFGETYEVSGKKALRENTIFYLKEFYINRRRSVEIPFFWYGKIYEICKKYHIDLNESINGKNQSFLHVAAASYLDSCSSDNSHCIEALLECGLKVNQRDAGGNTPLDIARTTLHNAKWYNEKSRQIALKNIQLLESKLNL